MKRNNGVIAAIQVVWQSLTLLVVYRVAAQTAGVGTLGAWSTAVALAGLITVADAGFTDVAVREVAHANGKSDWPRVKGLCRSLFLFVPPSVGLLGLLATPVIARVLGALAPDLGETTVTLLTTGAVVSVWLTVLGTGAAGILEAFGRYDLKAAAMFASGSLSIFAAYATVPLVPDLALVIALVVGATANLAYLLGASYLVLRRLPGHARPPTAGERRDMLNRGVNARLGALANLGLDPVVRYLLLRFGGAEAAGLYEIVYRLIFQLRGVFVASMQVIVPRLTHQRASGAVDATTNVGALTTSSIRLAAPALWGVLIVLPMLSVAMLGRMETPLLIYGLSLTLAWLTNVIAVPAYYANFVDGNLRVNRISHFVMVIAAAVLGAPAGIYFGALGVVVATSMAIGLGSVYILRSRRVELASTGFPLSRPERVVNLVGFLGSAAIVAAAVGDLPAHQQVYLGLATIGLYGLTALRPMARLVSEHLRLVAG